MRKAGILVAVGILALFMVACGGGGGGGETPTVGGETPTAAPVIKGELIQITGKADFTLEPKIIELKLGKAYQFQLLNRGDRFYSFRIPRFDVRLGSVAGADSPLSNVVVPDLVGDYGCFEENLGASRGMKCTVRVSE